MTQNWKTKISLRMCFGNVFTTIYFCKISPELKKFRSIFLKKKTWNKRLWLFLLGIKLLSPGCSIWNLTPQSFFLRPPTVNTYDNKQTWVLEKIWHAVGSDKQCLMIKVLKRNSHVYGTYWPIFQFLCFWRIIMG